MTNAERNIAFLAATDAATRDATRAATIAATYAATDAAIATGGFRFGARPKGGPVVTLSRKRERGRGEGGVYLKIVQRTVVIRI